MNGGTMREYPGRLSPKQALFASGSNWPLIVTTIERIRLNKLAISFNHIRSSFLLKICNSVSDVIDFIQSLGLVASAVPLATCLEDILKLFNSTTAENICCVVIRLV